MKEYIKDKMSNVLLLALTFTLDFVSDLLRAIGLMVVVLTLLGYVTFKV